MLFKTSSDNLYNENLVLIQQKHDPNYFSDFQKKFKEEQLKSKQNYKKDLFNICFLMFLYLLQGVPIGLMMSLPYILSENKTSYNNQGMFSFASWPYSMKLLWAPIVDSLYSKKFGRRKSWLIPVQYMIGICMLLFSNYVHNVLETGSASKNSIDKDISNLTMIFFLFTFLSATQDVAVDGWGLTILLKENLEWASICNNAGATSGVMIGNTLFLVLESHQFCNDYIRPFFGLKNEATGLLDLRSFMNFFGVVYIVSTTLILFFKTENKKNFNYDSENQISIKETYLTLWSILKLKPVQQIMIILFTCKIAFATSGIRSLKMIEAGVPKEKLSLMNTPFQIIQIITPIFFGNVSRPLDLFLKVYPLRMILTFILAVWVWFTPFFEYAEHQYSWNFFIIYFLMNGIYSLVFAILALAKTMFFTQVSDKSIGGTYMTLLNTISNIGVNWPATLALYLVDTLSFKSCEMTVNSKLYNSSKVERESYIKKIQTAQINTCSNDKQIMECTKLGAECNVTIDAYYTLTCVALFIGGIWLYHYSRNLKKLQSLPRSNWHVLRSSEKKKRKKITLNAI